MRSEDVAESAEDKVMTSEWVESPERALQQASTSPRHPSVAPHWIRCQWFQGEARCRKAEGHLGEHVALALVLGLKAG